MKKFISLFLIFASFYSFSQNVVIDLDNPSYVYDRSKNIYLFDTANFVHNGDTLNIIAGYNSGAVTLWQTTADTTYFVGLIKMDSILIGLLHAGIISVDSLYAKIAKIDTLVSDTVYILITYVLSITADSLFITDTDMSNTLHLKWNENDGSNRTFNIKVNSGDRTLDLSENLFVLGGYDVYLQALNQNDTLQLNNSLYFNKDAGVDGRNILIEMYDSSLYIYSGGALGYGGLFLDNLVYFRVSDEEAPTSGLNIKFYGGNRTLYFYENLTIPDGEDVSLGAEDNSTTILMDNSNFEVENANVTQRDMKIVIGTDANAQATFEGTGSINNQDVTTDSDVDFNSADIVDNLTAGDIVIDEATGVLSFIGATSSDISSTADLTISTTANGEDINITPHGTGDVNISKIDVADGEIDNTVIGVNSETTGKFTTVQSTQATGTAPFTVASTTKVTNLNVDKLDGSDWGDVTEIGSVTNLFTAWMDSIKGNSPLWVYRDSIYFKRNIYVNDTVDASAFTIGANTLNTDEWAYLDGQDQEVKELSDVQFQSMVLKYPTTSLTTMLTFINNPTNANSGINMAWNVRADDSAIKISSFALTKTDFAAATFTTQFEFKNYSSGSLISPLRINGDSTFIDSILTVSGKSFFGDDMEVTGNVGVGIASPTSKLQVYSDDNPNGVFMVDIDNHDGSGTDARGLKVRGGALNAAIPIFVIADYNDVPKFSVMGGGAVDIVNALTAGTITSDGNITINTGDTLFAISPNGQDTNMYYNTNDTNYVGKGDNPTKIGNSLIVATDGNVTTTGDIEVAGYVKIGTLNHAIMRFADSTSTYDFTINNWQAISNATDSLFRKIEFDNLTYSGDSIIINYAADYDGILSLSLSGAANDVWEIRVNHEGVEVSKMLLKFGAQIAEGSITVPFYIYQASVGDYVVFEIRNTANNNDPTFNSAIVTMQYLHETN